MDWDVAAEQAFLQQCAEELMREAQRLGASASEVAANASQGLIVAVRKGETEKLEFIHSRGAGVTVYCGQRRGSASTSDLSPAALADTVRAAYRIASYAQDDPYAGLAESALMAKDFKPLDVFHPWAIAPEQAMQLALDCEAAGLAVDPRIHNSDGASLSTRTGAVCYGNSNGFLHSYANTHHSLSCGLIAQQDGEMQRDGWYETVRDWRDLSAPALIGKKAGENTVERLGSRTQKTTKVPVLFRADVARGILGHFTSAINGGTLYRKASFLLDSLGKQVFPSWFSLKEFPHLPKGLRSSNFDGDGLATRENEFVVDGVVNQYILDTYTGRKLNMPSSANAGGVHNLFASAGQDDFAALVKKMHRGLVVTELMGQGINLVTGDYSRGAAGFWVENGEIQYPVHQVTIAGNLRDMFANLVAVGADVDRRGGIHTGSILFAEMTLAGSA